MERSSVSSQILYQLSCGNFEMMIVYWKEVAVVMGSRDITEQYNPLMEVACQLCDDDIRSKTDQIEFLSGVLNLRAESGHSEMTRTECDDFVINVMRLTYLKGHFLESHDKGIELLSVDRSNPICMAYYAIVFGRKFLIAGVVSSGEAWRDDRPLEVMLADFYAEYA